MPLKCLNFKCSPLDLRPLQWMYMGLRDFHVKLMNIINCRFNLGEPILNSKVVRKNHEISPIET